MKTLENLRNYLENQDEVVAAILERDGGVAVGFAQDAHSKFFIEEFLSKEEFEEIKRDWTFVENWQDMKTAADFIKFKETIIK